MGESALFTCGCKVGIDIGVGYLPSDLCPGSGSNRVQVVGNIRRVRIRILGGNVVYLGVYESVTMAGHNCIGKYTSKFPARGDNILLLQKLCAFEQTEFDPPLLHEVICAILEYSTCNND